MALRLQGLQTCVAFASEEPLSISSAACRQMLADVADGSASLFDDHFEMANVLLGKGDAEEAVFYRNVLPLAPLFKSNLLYHAVAKELERQGIKDPEEKSNFLNFFTRLETNKQIDFVDHVFFSILSSVDDKTITNPLKIETLRSNASHLGVSDEKYIEFIAALRNQGSNHYAGVKIAILLTFISRDKTFINHVLGKKKIWQKILKQPETPSLIMRPVLRTADANLNLLVNPELKERLPLDDNELSAFIDQSSHLGLSEFARENQKALSWVQINRVLQMPVDAEIRTQLMNRRLELETAYAQWLDVKTKADLASAQYKKDLDEQTQLQNFLVQFEPLSPNEMDHIIGLAQKANALESAASTTYNWCLLFNAYAHRMTSEFFMILVEGYFVPEIKHYKKPSHTTEAYAVIQRASLQLDLSPTDVMKIKSAFNVEIARYPEGVSFAYSVFNSQWGRSVPLHLTKEDSASIDKKEAARQRLAELAPIVVADYENYSASGLAKQKLEQELSKRP